jgi:hypothetical protein
VKVRRDTVGFGKSVARAIVAEIRCAPLEAAQDRQSARERSDELRMFGVRLIRADQLSSRLAHVTV